MPGGGKFPVYLPNIERNLTGSWGQRPNYYERRRGSSHCLAGARRQRVGDDKGCESSATSFSLCDSHAARMLGNVDGLQGE